MTEPTLPSDSDFVFQICRIQICHMITACCIKLRYNYVDKTSLTTLVFVLLSLSITYYIHCYNDAKVNTEIIE